MADKLANLSKKEKEVRQLSAGILDREERVKKKELEVSTVLFICYARDP